MFIFGHNKRYYSLLSSIYHFCVFLSIVCLLYLLPTYCVYIFHVFFSFIYTTQPSRLCLPLFQQEGGKAKEISMDTEKEDMPMVSVVEDAKCRVTWRQVICFGVSEKWIAESKSVSFLNPVSPIVLYILSFLFLPSFLSSNSSCFFLAFHPFSFFLYHLFIFCLTS